MSIFSKIYHKFKIDIAWNRLASSIARARWKPLKIMSIPETIDYILDTNCSIARYGDGELYIAGYGMGLKFQKPDELLQKRLIQVLHNDNPNLLLCISDRLNVVTKAEMRKLAEHWQKTIPQDFYAWTKHIVKDYHYGAANISRFVGLEDYESPQHYIEHIKKIWNNRNLIVVEGEKTRFGVGNDLFDNILSIKRILGPAESAFDHYDELLEESINLANQLENPLVLIALGPTATVLASDLADSGIQALDIGHLDICYEQFKLGGKVAVSGKYTNEITGGECVEDCADEDYLKQIVKRIL